MKKYQRCTRCIMDNKSDDKIRFDKNGYCNYCTSALAVRDKEWFPNAIGQQKLQQMVQEVKTAGKTKKYDCILGLSGGLDSSYLTYLAYKLGLRALVVHIDDGYDTKIAASNIQKLIEKSGFDYEVIKPDSEQYNALTLAFMKAGVANIATPQDNILFAFLYSRVKEYKIPYLLSGVNFSLESILQHGNTHSAYDVIQIKDIARRFCDKPIDKLKFISSNRILIDRYLLKIKTFAPLNYVDYTRDKAFKELADFCGFEYYGRKHLENILTAFIQLRWFPEKFGVDKRTSHLSSMIVSDQMTRDEALKELEEPIYNEEQMAEYVEIIKRNMKLTDEEFERIMKAPAHRHEEYKIENRTVLFQVLRAVRFLRRMFR